MEIDSLGLEEALKVLGQLLEERGYHYEVVAIGGGSLLLLGQFEQICFKLYASVDQGPNSKHFTDLATLKPTKDELQKAKSWCITQDVSESFELEINKALESIHAFS